MKHMWGPVYDNAKLMLFEIIVLLVKDLKTTSGISAQELWHGPTCRPSRPTLCYNVSGDINTEVYRRQRRVISHSDKGEDSIHSADPQSAFPRGCFLGRIRRAS